MQNYERLIVLEGAHNIRDLGGYKTDDGGVTRWRSILRGDALHGLSSVDIDMLIEHGLTTVIDLRNEAEIAAEPNPFITWPDVHYLNVSLFSPLAPVEMMAAASTDFNMGERYCRAFDDCQEAIASVLTAIAEARPGLLLFHCTAGKDRTGLIAALLLASAGVDDATIVEDYALTAHLSAPLLARLKGRALARGTEPRLIDIVLASEPGSMRKALNHLREAHGGLSSYLAKIGINEQARERLTTRLKASNRLSVSL